MIKKTIFLLAILTLTMSTETKAVSNDTSNISKIIAFDWQPISDADKVLQFQKEKDLSKRSIDQAKLAKRHYDDAILLMNNDDYNAAIVEFKAAMKRYKRAKLNDDALNFIRTNMALSYASSGNNEDKAVAERFLNLLTSKVFDENKWTYNIAIAHYLIGNHDDAASLLSSVIRKDEFYFQAYVTLEAIYKNSGNYDDANKVAERMEKAAIRLTKRNNKNLTKENTKKENKKKIRKIEKGIKPDVTNLNIVSKDDHLQFNKVSEIDERSMIQIQEGITEYNLGVAALKNKEYKTAQIHLKNAEKRLKRGKITDDGLNFSRGNLTIAFLATGEKRGIGQAKRYLKNITNKLNKTREWTYNLAVASYAFASKSRGVTRDDFMNKSIKLFQLSIKRDKLFLPAYQNLIYIYRELKEENKALKIQNSFEKSRKQLMQSFSKEEQLAQGNDPYIFRVNVGTFGEFDTPVRLFEEDYLITIPVDEKRTTYLSGMFYNLDDATDYQKRLKKEGYKESFIVGFKNGKKIDL